MGLAGWEEALLIGAGAVLLAAELLLIPGFGVAGILGIAAVGAGVFLSFLGSYPSPADLWRAATAVLTSMAFIAVGAGVMIARVQEMRAKLVEAEAQVPQAIAEAFRQGNIGVRDYYDLRNIQPVTQMRESLATGEEGRRQESE